jgi:hypothetical protein
MIWRGHRRPCLGVYLPENPWPRAAAEATSPASSLALMRRGLKNQIRDFARMR